MMKVLRCPQCDADIQLDEKREFGFCSYCGAKILINDYIKSERKDDINNFLARAKEYRVNGEFYKAAEYYNKVLDLDINNTEAKTALSQIAPYIKTTAPYVEGQVSKATVIGFASEASAKCKLPNGDIIQLFISNISSDHTKRASEVLHIGDVIEVVYRGVDKIGRPYFRTINVDKEKTMEENMPIVERARYLEEKRKISKQEENNQKEAILADKICGMIKNYMLQGKHDIKGYYCCGNDDGYSMHFFGDSEKDAVNITDAYRSDILIKSIMNTLHEYGLNDIDVKTKPLHIVEKVQEVGNYTFWLTPKYKTVTTDKIALYINVHW